MTAGGPGGGDAAHLAHDREQRHDALDALLNRLPLRLRVPVALRFLAQLEIAEVAVLCDLGLSQVRQYVNEGCLRLAQMDVELLSQQGSG